MKKFELSDEQEKEMWAFMEKHNKSKCKYSEYTLEISLTAIADLASIKCGCGVEKHLGEV